METRIVLKKRIRDISSLWYSTKRHKKYQENKTKLLDWIETNDRVKGQAKQNFMDTEYTLKLYNKAHIQDLDLREPQLFDYYKLSVLQKQGWNDLRQRNGFGFRFGHQSFLGEHKRNWKDKFQEFIIGLNAFGRDWLQWRGWLKEPECVKMMQSFGGWSKSPSKFFCLPQSISRDLLLMLNLQMQSIKLIFFSFLITHRPQGCRNSTSTHW